MIPLEARRKIELEFDEVIERIVDDCGDHSGIGRAQIVRWLYQFTEPRWALAAKILTHIRYYSSSQLNTMGRELTKVIYKEFSDIPKSKIAWVPIGSAGSGSQLIARILRSFSSVPKSSIIGIHEVEKLKPGEKSVLVCLEDFSGTGHTIDKWWKNVEPVFSPKKAEVVLGALIVNWKAREVLEKAIPKVFCVEDLDRQHAVFDSECIAFTGEEKAQILEACTKTGCSGDYLRGWGECGLLLALQHGCPNDSLPVLWHEKTGVWGALFKRRSI